MVLAPVSDGFAPGTLQQAEGGVGRGGGRGEAAVSGSQSHDRPLLVSAYKVFAHGISALLWTLWFCSPGHYFYHCIIIRTCDHYYYYCVYRHTHHLPWCSERVSISSFRFVFFSDKINYLGRFTSFLGITQVTY